MDFVVSVILPAGGHGLRMENHIPKQFCRILNRPVISFTIENFERFSWIGDIVVCVSMEHQDLMQQIIKDFNHKKVRLVTASESRHRSIYAGVKALETNPPDIVIIHDAVRLFVPEKILLEVILAAKNFGASGAVNPLVSTIIAQDPDGLLDHSLDRSLYRASEMPQSFQYHIIKNAYEKCSTHDLDFGTECLNLALKYSNVKAKLIYGNSDLWKITYRKDLYAAEGMIKEKYFDAVIIPCKSSSLKHLLYTTLSKKLAQVELCDNMDTASLSASCCVFLETDFDPDAFQKIMHNFFYKQFYRNHIGVILVLECPATRVRQDFLSDVVKFSRNMAHELKSSNSFFNIICRISEEDNPELDQQMAHLTTQCVFDRNLKFTGQVYLV